MHVAPTTELWAFPAPGRAADCLAVGAHADGADRHPDDGAHQPQALAGGGLGAASYSFVSIFCLGVIAAVGTLVAIRKGAGDIEGATRLTQAGLWLAWADGAGAGWCCGTSTGAAAVRPEPETCLGRRISHPAALALPGYLSFMALRGFTSAWAARRR
jgi:MATE family multidrug resistance protein